MSVGVTTVTEVVRLMLLREDGDGTRSPPDDRIACMGDEGNEISLEVPVDPRPSAGAIVKLLDSGAPPIPDANEFMLAMFLLPTGIGRRDWESLFKLSVVDSFLVGFESSRVVVLV